MYIVVRTHLLPSVRPTDIKTKIGVRILCHVHKRGQEIIIITQEAQNLITRDQVAANEVRNYLPKDETSAKL